MKFKNARTRYRLFVAPLIAEELEVRTLFSMATGTLSVVYVPSDGPTDNAPTTPGNDTTTSGTNFTGSVSETFIVALPAGEAQGEWVVDASTGDVLKQDPNGGAGAGLSTINVTGNPTGNLLMVVSPDKVSFVVMEDAAPVSTASLPESENASTVAHGSLQITAPLNGAGIVASDEALTVDAMGAGNLSGQALVSASSVQGPAGANSPTVKAESDAESVRTENSPPTNGNTVSVANASTSTHVAVAARAMDLVGNESQKIVDDPGMFEGEFTVLAKAPLPKREKGPPMDENDAYATAGGNELQENRDSTAVNLALPKVVKTSGATSEADTKNKNRMDTAITVRAAMPHTLPDAPAVVTENSRLLAQMNRVTKWWKAAALMSLATGLYFRRDESTDKMNE